MIEIAGGDMAGFRRRFDNYWGPERRLREIETYIVHERHALAHHLVDALWILAVRDDLFAGHYHPLP